jgi:hypothetical protein
MTRKDPNGNSIGDRFALKLQELRTEGKVGGDQPLLRIDSRDEAAKAPYQFDTARAKLHRTGCDAIPRASRSALLARWGVSPDESDLGCERCRPGPTERRAMRRNPASDLLYGMVSILDQFGNVLRERGKEYRESEQGRQLTSDLEGLYANLDKRQKDALDVVLSSLDGLLVLVQEYDGSLRAGNGNGAGRRNGHRRNGNQRTRG